MSLTEIPGPTGPNGRVISQEPMLVRGAGGHYVDGFRITAQLNSGTQFTVDIAKADYTPENVTALLKAHAAVIGGVDALTF